MDKKYLLTSRAMLVFGVLAYGYAGMASATDEELKRWSRDVPCNRVEPDRIIDESKKFTDVTLSAGIVHRHNCNLLGRGVNEERQIMVGGVAVGDYDRDGWPDIYLVGGSGGTNRLYRNLGDGTFEEMAVKAGVAISGAEGSGPIFADYDGDGWLDLLVTGVNKTPPSLFHNRGDGTFEDLTQAAGIDGVVNSFSATFGDYDRDGDLDLYLAHFLPVQESARLWRNNADGSFTDVSEHTGVAGFGMNDFTANFTDINNDGWPDLLVAADYETSQVFINNQDGTFRNTTTEVISDENGMGASIGDYDNDGNLDWFVSSISTGGITGNRLYRNQGDGTFVDMTDKAKVRYGGWGWASCFADFDNDGYLDIFHTNGFGRLVPSYDGENNYESSVLFMSNGKNWLGRVSFTERAKELGIADTTHGRGVACFDYDRDGDLDIFVANNNQAPHLYRNNGIKDYNYLNVRLEGKAPNSEAIGARVYIKVDGNTQMRELRAGSNYLSQDLAMAHFGLKRADKVDELRIVWPSQRTTIMQDVAANQFLVIKE